MLRSHEFWLGVVAGLVGLYIYHRVAGVNTNAPVKPA